MIVSVSGLGYTGSGAVIDLLKEFNDIVVPFEDELTICYMPDGISDLEKVLFSTPVRFMSSDVSFYRFYNVMRQLHKNNQVINKMGKNFFTIVKEYLDSITEIKWRGHWGFDVHQACFIKRIVDFSFPNRMRRVINKLGFKYNRLNFSREMRYSNSPENFLIETKKFISKLMKLLNVNLNDKVVFNQLFPGDFPEKYFKYFSSSKVIVVDRDPRDLYILVKHYLGDQAAWIPTSNIHDFIKYYSMLREFEDTDCKNILRLNFEDLLYSYESSVKKICEFLCIKEHAHKNKYFNPEKSIKNTQLFKKHPQYKYEIELIEKKLSGFLYDFTYSISHDEREDIF